MKALALSLAVLCLGAGLSFAENGKIKTYDAAKGTGTIAPDVGGKPFPFTKKALAGRKWEKLHVAPKPGQKVTFRRGDTFKGTSAFDVRLVEAPAADGKPAEAAAKP